MKNDFTINWDAVSALANVVMAFGVFLAYVQIRMTRQLAQTDFEDRLAKESRDIISKLPSSVLLGDCIDESKFDDLIDDFYRYFDLSNEQILLRNRGRIKYGVWKEWCDGMKFNMKLNAFQRAWQAITKRKPIFGEFRILMDSNFELDPRQSRFSHLCTFANLINK